MRSAFLRSLARIAANDRRAYLVTADTGFKVFDDFQREFPDCYLNAGISEQAMVGVAAGLAIGGKRPFIYGIVPFVTLRCLDQIRNDLCLHRLPVTVVGVGEGLSYGAEGATHHAVEDIAVMASLPGMTVICPGDPVEVERAVAASLEIGGPVYLRLGKNGEPVIHKDGLPSFQVGRAVVVRCGDDVGILSTGNMLSTALETAGRLESVGIHASVASMHTVKPIDRDRVTEMGLRFPIVATIEEHGPIGGLASMVASVMAESGSGATLLRFSLPDYYCDAVGDQQHLREHFRLTSEAICQRIWAACHGD